MEKKYSILQWDSEFFGFTVARIQPDRLRFQELRKTVDVMRLAGVVLAYWASDPDDLESQDAAQRCDGVLVDRKVTYAIDAAEIPAGMSAGGGCAVEEYHDPVPNPELEALAVEAGMYSRFKVDPRIPEAKFVELYKSWIRNSVNRKIADGVFVVRNNGKVVGMVTVGEKNRRADIGLIAVDAAMRGRSVGPTLVREALSWGLQKGYATAQVVTQGENQAACRLYEKCGYSIDKIENIYHLWIAP